MQAPSALEEEKGSLRAELSDLGDLICNSLRYCARPVLEGWGIVDLHALDVCLKYMACFASLRGGEMN